MDANNFNIEDANKLIEDDPTAAADLLQEVMKTKFVIYTALLFCK